MFRITQQRQLLVTLAIFVLPMALIATWDIATSGATQTMFVDSGQRLGLASTDEVLLGDLDGDGSADAFVANHVNAASKLWLNDGEGGFQASTENLPVHRGGYGSGAALGDVDNDGDLDVVAVGGDANYLLLNSGNGQFSSSQDFPAPEARFTDAEMGDLDNDGDLDLVLARTSSNQVWLNDGTGQFTDSTQALGAGWTNKIRLGDMDGDGDLDLIAANGTTGAQFSKIWLNNGNAEFVEGADAFQGWSYDLAVADFDGDADLDVFFTSWTSSNELWLNDGDGNLTSNGQSLGDSGHIGAGLADVDGDGAVDVLVAQYNSQAYILYRNVGNGLLSSEPQTIAAEMVASHLATGDLDGDSDLDLFLGIFGQNQVWFNDDSPSLSPSTIGTLQQVRDELLPQTPVGRYYSSLYHAHLSELMMIAATNPSIAFDAWDTLELWTPALSTLVVEQVSDDETSPASVISQEMTDGALEVIWQIQERSSPELQAIITHEQSAVDLTQFTGQSIGDAWTELNTRVITELYLPMIVTEPAQ